MEIDATVPDGATGARCQSRLRPERRRALTTSRRHSSVTDFSPSTGPAGTVVDVKGIGFDVGIDGEVRRRQGDRERHRPERADGHRPQRRGERTGDADRRGRHGARRGQLHHDPTIDSFSPPSAITGKRGDNHRIRSWPCDGREVRNLVGVVHRGFGDAGSRATVPDGAVPGNEVSVTTPTGSSTSGQDFVPSLSITSVSPSSGPVGTVVTVRGVGFTPGSAMSFNGAAATAVDYVNPGEVQATVPSVATNGPVTLTNATVPTGTVRARAGYAVTPLTSPTIASFTPTSGITGSSVTVTGTNLSGANSVKFGASRRRGSRFIRRRCCARASRAARSRG